MSGTTTGWATPDSILSPLTIRLRVNNDKINAAKIAWDSAGNSVPFGVVKRNVLVDRRTVTPIPHIRKVVLGSGTEHALLARLVDRRDGESTSDAWGRWRWSLGLRLLNNPGVTAVGDSVTVMRLEVTRFRLSSGAVLDAAPLALFRHRFVEGLKAVDPDFSVAGGQCHWDEAWWPVASDDAS